MKTYRVILFSLILGSAQHAYAQDSNEQDSETKSSIINTSEGISGEIDKKRREPTVSVETVVQEGNVKLLVDAYIAATEYSKYPIQFDFYINRNFYTSQIRSTELPGPIGIDIPSSLARPPFNYSIIAKTLHPNSVYTTIVNGAAFSSNLTKSLDCTLTTGADSSSSVEYIANAVTPSQTSNNTIAIEFETESTPSGHSVKLTSSLSVADETATGTIEIQVDNGTAQSITISGEAVKNESGVVSDLNLASSDNATTLVCS
jgi:hypothetical protein